MSKRSHSELDSESDTESENEISDEFDDDLINIDGNALKSYGIWFDEASKKIYSNPDLKRLYYAKDIPGDVSLKFHDREIKLHLLILKNSFGEFSKIFGSTNEIQIDNFNLTEIEPVFKWIYYKRFETANLPIKSMIEILRFSDQFKIQTFMEKENILYLSNLLQNFLSSTFVSSDIFYVMNLPNKRLYQKIKDNYIQKFIEILIKYSNPNLIKLDQCRSKDKNYCCMHGTSRSCSVNPFKAYSCCQHISNVLLKILTKLRRKDSNEILRKLMNIRSLDLSKSK